MPGDKEEISVTEDASMIVEGEVDIKIEEIVDLIEAVEDMTMINHEETLVTDQKDALTVEKKGT